MYQKRNNEFNIISLFRKDYKSRFYLRQISSLSKIPLKTCQDTIKHLEKNNILKSKTEGKNKYFFLNLDNIKTKHYLLHSEIYQTDVFIEKYPAIKLFLKSISNNIPLIVFGSFAKFSADKDSDLDLLIVSDKSDFQFHLLPYKLHQLNLKESTFIKSNEAIIKQIQENHIILNNHSFFVNYMWSKYA